MKNKPIQYLEDLLKSWEDWCFMQQTAILYAKALGHELPGPYVGAYKNWEQLRGDILKRKVFNEPSYGIPSELCGALQLFGAIPFYVWSWSYWSRRVFSISRNLQALLMATAARNITLADVVLPFPAFVLELAKPLVDNHGREVVAILVTSGSPSAPLEAEQEINIIPLFRDDDRKHILPDILRSQLKKLVSTGQLRKVSKLHGALSQNLASPILGGLLLDRKKQGSYSVMTPIRTMFPRCNCGQDHPDDPIVEQMLRLVAGFCLYLQTVPSGPSTGVKWSALPKSAKSDPRAIINEAQICEIGHEVVLEPEELQIIEGRYITEDEAEAQEQMASGHIMGAHFRVGYWRRKPGCGQDPNAPKIVRVRPTIVRRDRLQEGEIPPAVRVKMQSL